MKKSSIFLTYLLTYLLAFSPIKVVGQTVMNYTNNVEIVLPDNCSCKSIVLEVNTSIVDNTSLECGEYDVQVTFNVLEGAECVETPDDDIYRIRWYTSPGFKNYNPKKSTSVHFSNMGPNKIRLKFSIKTNCGIFHDSLDYEVVTPDNCSGCYSAVSYCDLYCNPNPEYDDKCGYEYYDDDGEIKSQLPVIEDSLRFIEYTNFINFVNVCISNDYGIFNFPYYGRDEEDCPNLVPGLYELVEDINEFLDLYRTGQPEYANFYGHVSLMDSYGDGDLCKTRINFVDMGMFFLGFHKIKHYEFDLFECKKGDYLNKEDEHFDPRFGYDDSCIVPWAGMYSYDDFQEYLFDIMSDENYKSNKTTKSKDIESVKLFDCYPTIAQDNIKISWSYNNDNNSIEIYDVRGERLNKIDNIRNVNTLSIDLSKYKPGVYFIKLENKDTGYFDIEKIIKK